MLEEIIEPLFQTMLQCEQVELKAPTSGTTSAQSRRPERAQQ